MTRGGRKRKAKRTRPVHDRQRRKKLVKEVQELYGSEAEAEAGDGLWDVWQHEAEPTKTRAADPRSPGAGGARPGDVAGEPGPTSPKTGGDSASTPAPVERPATLPGQVVALGSGYCAVELTTAEAPENRQVVDAVLPSRFAAAQQSLLAVGDEVDVLVVDEGHRLDAVRPRRRELARPDPHNPRRHRVIAANIDVVVVVTALVEPPLRPALVDRYRIAIERGGAEPLLVVNKIDQEEDPAQLDRRLEVLEPHRQGGLRVIPCSAKDGRGLDALRQALAGRIAAFVGHSGVGKSSLANALAPALDLHTAEVGGGGSGRHTTTRSNLYHLPGDLHLIDTPGVREFGLWQLGPAELRSYFQEFDVPATRCRFNDCSHTHEPECGVLEDLAAGHLRRDRYQTYRRILASLDDET